MVILFWDGYTIAMYCYEIWVRSNKYHNKRPLTYTSAKRLLPGTVVKVDLRNSEILGIVHREAVPPKGVAMKPILSVQSENESQILPNETLHLISWLLVYYPTGSGLVCQLILPSIWPKINLLSTSPAPINNFLLDLGKTSAKSKPVLVNSEASLSDGEVVIATKTAEKLIMDDRNGSDEAGILPKSSLAKSPPKLTVEQSRAIKQINNGSGSFLLHGDTGSGKTRLYLELILENLNNDKSCLILVPEIGLISHIFKQLSDYIDPNDIYIFHSNLTTKQHRQTWLKILSSSSAKVILGPRSALFLPLKSIGLIVVDECHDDGYNQTNSPVYSGLRVASKLAELHNSTLIFGSATPAISDYYIAQQKKIPIIRMKELAININKNPVEIKIINKLDKTKFTISRTLSTSLINQITKNLKQNQQILLFLNRRGSAKVVACNNCGWRALCRNCDLSLTFHEDKFMLVCHTCGYNTKVPSSCPDCNKTDIIFTGPGTKSIETEIKKLFPQAIVSRFDSDNLTNERIDRKLNAINNGEIDIIIGTQVLVKGFDIPKLSLVGIIDADASLTFPDFSTEENTYQLLSQAIGRVGRGHTPGTVIIQSLQPKNNLLRQSVTKSWDSFYNSQLALRKQHNFPPFCFLVKLECSRKQRSSLIKSSREFKSTLLKAYPNITILGPAPSFQERHNNTYTWQLIVKSTRRSVLLKIIENLPSGWRYFLDPSHLL